MAVSYLKRETSPQQTIFSKEDWSSAYCNVEKELDHAELKLVKGSIPKQISGTFYRNGPGRLERGGRWVHHPFDGDGMIAAFKFDNGKINLTNRFVRTKEWTEEEKSQKFLYRGVFGTQKEGGVLANALHQKHSLIPLLLFEFQIRLYIEISGIFLLLPIPLCEQNDLSGLFSHCQI